MTFIKEWDLKKGNPFYRSAPAPGFQVVNFKLFDAEVTITDARPLRDTFSLDRSGFVYLDDSEGLSDELLDALSSRANDLVQQLYYPRVETLVKRETGASRVIIFDHTMRKRDPTRDKTDNTTEKEQPATAVHCDRTVVPKQKGRIRMINFWRPLNGDIVDWPLAQMDFTTLNARHVHPVDLWHGEYEERGQTDGHDRTCAGSTMVVLGSPPN